MNERIKLLAEQMGWEEMGADLYGKSMDGCMTIHALEKFAQLIVRECAKIANIADESKCEWIGGNILIHFGVEE